MSTFSSDIVDMFFYLYWLDTFNRGIDMPVIHFKEHTLYN